MTAPQDYNRNTIARSGDALAKTRPKVRLPIPEALADVALIDATDSAAGGGMCVSWWHDEVRERRAPQPVIRKPRCTRWLLADVRAFWIRSAEQAGTDTTAAKQVKAQAAKASASAKAKRATQAATAGAAE